MNKMNGLAAGLLVVLGCLIWARANPELGDLENTLPPLIALPLFFWLGRPWRFATQEERLPQGQLACVALLLALGMVIGSSILLALAWSLGLVAFLKLNVPRGHWPTLHRLALLPAMAFPWTGPEFERLGWAFRVSAAWTAQQFFVLADLPVDRSGTLVLIGEIGLDVEPQCSGMRMLQALLVIGTALAYVQMAECRRYWWHLPLLLVAAWAANALRVIVLGIAALSVDATFAQQVFHVTSGTLLLALMFLICTALFGLVGQPASATKSTETRGR